MNKINKKAKEEIVGGIAATTVFSIITIVATGISLVSSVVTGVLNVVNASKKKNAFKKSENDYLHYNKSFEPLSYTKII